MGVPFLHRSSKLPRNRAFRDAEQNGKPPPQYVPDDHPRSRIPEKDGREGGEARRWLPTRLYPPASNIECGEIRWQARHNDLVRRDKVADQICPISPNLPETPRVLLLFPTHPVPTTPGYSLARELN